MNRPLVYFLLILLFLLHQDFWLWGNGKLMLGFLPIGLAYHIVFSLLSALVWFLAVRFAWPTDLEGEEEGGSE